MIAISDNNAPWHHELSTPPPNDAQRLCPPSLRPRLKYETCRARQLDQNDKKQGNYTPYATSVKYSVSPWYRECLFWFVTCSKVARIIVLSVDSRILVWCVIKIGKFGLAPCAGVHSEISWWGNNWHQPSNYEVFQCVHWPALQILHYKICQIF